MATNKIYEVEMCECGHIAPIEFIKYDSEMVGTCPDCYIKELESRILAPNESRCIHCGDNEKEMHHICKECYGQIKKGADEAKKGCRLVDDCKLDDDGERDCKKCRHYLLK